MLHIESFSLSTGGTIAHAVDASGSSGSVCESPQLLGSPRAVLLVKQVGFALRHELGHVSSPRLADLLRRDPFFNQLHNCVASAQYFDGQLLELIFVRRFAPVKLLGIEL